MRKNKEKGEPTASKTLAFCHSTRRAPACRGKSLSTTFWGTGGRINFSARMKRVVLKRGPKNGRSLRALTKGIQLRFQDRDGLKSPPDGINDISNVNCTLRNNPGGSREAQTTEGLRPPISVSPAGRLHIKTLPKRQRKGHFSLQRGEETGQSSSYPVESASAKGFGEERPESPANRRSRRTLSNPKACAGGNWVFTTTIFRAGRNSKDTVALTPPCGTKQEHLSMRNEALQ